MSGDQILCEVEGVKIQWGNKIRSIKKSRSKRKRDEDYVDDNDINNDVGNEASKYRKKKSKKFYLEYWKHLLL